MPRIATQLSAVALPLVLGACVGAPPLRTGIVDDPRASPAALADWMALPAEGAQREFFVGDHVDGYYSGRTGSHRGGPGWYMGPDRVWQDAVAWAGDRALRRDAPGADERVLPWGRITRLDDMVEDWTFHGGSRRLTIEVRADAPARLAVQPLWVDATAQASREGDLVLLRDTASGWIAALTASAPFDLDAAPDSALDPSLLLRARNPGTRFAVHVAFARDTAEASALARGMAIDVGLASRTRAALYRRLTRAWLATGDQEYDRALAWARASALLFEVREPEHGLWAGLPWFRENWGRDTFIALPGTFLVGGDFDAAREVLEHFARWQNLTPPAANAAAPGTADHLGIGARTSDYGRVPNFVKAGVASYNTVDATPWLIREALELARYSGDRELANRALAVAGPYIDGVVRHSLDADGLLIHDDADTWMDARIEGRHAWSPRGNRAIEVQALWYTALSSAAELADLAGDARRATAWRALAQRNRAAVQRLLWDGKRLADRLRVDGTRDLALRPNVLLAISVPWDDYLPRDAQALVLRDAVAHLLFPYGIASLAPQDPRFHPRHVDEARHHKDAAYHNGTVWGWNAGFVVTALTRHGHADLAWELSRNLADQILHLGAMGTMSELLDALPGPDGRPVPSGTPSQSWSVAEFARNAFQDFVGFRPDLLRGELHLSPALPAAWTRFEARLPFGPEARDEALRIDARRDVAGRWSFVLALDNGMASRSLVVELTDRAGNVRRVRFDLAPGAPATLAFDNAAAWLNGSALATAPVRASTLATTGTLRFRDVPPNDPARYPMTRGRDVLREIILGEALR